MADQNTGQNVANVAGLRLTLADGTDLADKINPRLLELTLTEKRGEESDQLDITIHNHDGAMVPPKAGAVLQLAIGWAKGSDVTPGLIDKGRFKVDEVERSGPPDTISIRARAADLTGEYRTRRDAVWKNKSLGQILQDIATRHGLRTAIHPDLVGKQIAVIEQAGKSDMQFVRDLGRRYDAVATVKDQTLVFMPIGAATTASGKAIPRRTITRRDGWNWTFRHAQRNEHDGAEARYQDQDAGRRRVVKSGGKKRKRLKTVYGSKGEAEAAAKAETERNRRAAYEFDYTLALGDPTFIPNQAVELKGWDSEIDALPWLVSEISTRLSAGGLTTSIKFETK